MKERTEKDRRALQGCRTWFSCCNLRKPEISFKELIYEMLRTQCLLLGLVDPAKPSTG